MYAYQISVRVCGENWMPRTDFERYLQRVSSKLSELAQTEQVPVDSLVALGRHYGIDVAAEILHRGKSVSAVLSMIAEKAGVPDRRRS
jgi:hypothetical protein